MRCVVLLFFSMTHPTHPRAISATRNHTHAAAPQEAIAAPRSAIAVSG